MKRSRAQAAQPLDFSAVDFSCSRLLVLDAHPPHGPELSVLAVLHGAAPSSHIVLASCAGALPQTPELLSALGADAQAVEQRGVLRAQQQQQRYLECALVRCAGPGAAARLLQRPLTARPTTDARGAPRGLRAWLSSAEAAAQVDTRGLQDSVDAAVRALDEAGAAAEREKDTLKARMQADGFTLVTRKSVLESEAEASGAAGNRRGKKRTRPGGNLHPQNYAQSTAQEDKVRRLEELRKGFEEDTRHIARLKAQRKFRPF
jgi:hypothetical protein